MAKVDMSGVSVGFELIPDQICEARIVGSEDVAASGGGTNVKVTFQLMGEDVEGRKLSKWFSLKDTALWSYKTMLTYAGVAPEALEGKIDTNDFHKVIIGEVVKVSIGHHDDKSGKTYNDIEVLDPSAEVGQVAAATW